MVVMIKSVRCNTAFKNQILPCQLVFNYTTIELFFFMMSLFVQYVSKNFSVGVLFGGKGVALGLWTMTGRNFNP